MSNSNIDDLITRISSLSLRQQRIISDVVDEIAQQEVNPTTRGNEIAPNTGVRLLPRVENPKFVSKNHIPLSVGDRVEILSSRKVGTTGDIAEVEVFNKLYVGVRLLHSGKSTQRASKYLRFIE